MEDLRGKVAIVIGGAMGIGKALCKELVVRGATVVIGDIRIDAAQVLGGSKISRLMSEMVYALVRGYLQAHRDEIDVEDLDLAAFVVVTTVEALTHAAVLRRPDILTDEKARQFVDDVTRLVVRYLRTS
jgi:NAD(P)-dependent dehydrogenase (short-subunit alcohol dehydrogenase family)